MTLVINTLILIKYKNCIISRGHWESVCCISSALRVLCPWFRIHRWYVDLWYYWPSHQIAADL